jgi:peptide subunit release factor 1 (eRF1)
MAKINITKQYVKQLSHLRAESGGTSLITMLIPSGYQLALVNNKISKELSTATNIKDKTVRKDVITALKSILGNISRGCSSVVSITGTGTKHTAPENGLVLLAGVTKQYV